MTWLLRALVIITVSVFFYGCLYTTSCVSRGTKILVPNGFKRIEEIKIGDKVISYDFTNNQPIESIVKKIVKSRSNRFYKLNDTLKITSDHVIYDSYQHDWVKVSDLNTNSKFITYNESKVITDFRNLVPISGKYESFDLVLEGEFNNYFANGILVHNKSPELLLCNKEIETGFCELSRGRPCLEDENEEFCGENYKPFCDQPHYAEGIYFDPSVVTPTYEDTVMFCLSNQE